MIPAPAALRALRPVIATGALLLFLLLLRSQLQPLPHIAPPHALLGQRVPAPLEGQFRAEPSGALPQSFPETVPAPNPPDAAPPGAVGQGEITAARSDQLTIVARQGSYSQAQAAALIEPLGAALAYVEERTAMRLAAPITIIFTRRPASCGLDGAADTGERTLYLYICPGISAQRAVNILAHEFVHQLAHDHYGPPHMEADLMLSEGLATWGAGKYWLGSQPDFRHFVARNYGGSLIPLATHYDAVAVPDAMNRLYYEWAALVEWIMETHDRSGFDRLYIHGTARRIGSAPFADILGAPWSEVENQWRVWLEH